MVDITLYAIQVKTSDRRTSSTPLKEHAAYRVELDFLLQHKTHRCCVYVVVFFYQVCSVYTVGTPSCRRQEEKWGMRAARGGEQAAKAGRAVSADSVTEIERQRAMLTAEAERTRRWGSER